MTSKAINNLLQTQTRRCCTAVQILGTFINGRVESWIHMRPLKPEEMCEPNKAACIARRLASFHAADIRGISKKPQVFERILKWYTLILMTAMHPVVSLCLSAHVLLTRQSMPAYGRWLPCTNS